MKNINPTGAISDFVTVFREAGKKRWWISLVAASLTLGSFSLITLDHWKKPRPLPEITYITAWPADRTEAETQAFIAENQKRKDALEKAQQQADEETRALWKALGRVSGMDVDKLDEQGRKDRAAQEAAEKAKLEQLTGQKVER